MKILIEPTHGGAVVRYDDGENIESFVYCFEEGNLDGLQSLFYDINDELLMTGRHDRFRIRFNIEHGDKYECNGCDWCKGGK